MRKIIGKYFMIVSALAIAASLILVSILFYDLFRAQVFEELKTYAHVVLYTSENVESIEKLTERYIAEENQEIRITLIDNHGMVLADSTADAAKMQYHGDREEVIEAFEKGSGEAVRNSDTLKRASYYVAVRMNDELVFRVSKFGSSLCGILLNVLPFIVIIVLALWLVCMALAKVLTDKLLRPIREIAENFGNKKTLDTYEELRPLVETIQNQHADILESAQMRQEFTANVSHELKTPLASISGYSELIEAGMVNEKDARRFAAEIHKSANRLLSLINDILELSKLDTLSEEMQIESVGLYDLAKACAHMLELNAAKRGVIIRVEGEEAYVHGSKRMLEEVVYNLCDNAIRYNKENGRVVLCVTNKADTVVLQVKDTGIGIPKEHQGRIFERFYRVDKSRSKSTGGTGLGLAIVKHIAAIHGAVIELESEEDKGTCITLTFSKKSNLTV